jgi:hypothetical protein
VGEIAEGVPSESVPFVAALLVVAESIDDALEELVDLHEEPHREERTPSSRARLAHELSEADDEDEADEEEEQPPVLAGRQPVSLLQEICQARGLSSPAYLCEREGGDDHVPKFMCSVAVAKGEDEEPVSVEVRGASTKADAKKAAARAMLIKHFGAREKH